MSSRRIQALDIGGHSLPSSCRGPQGLRLTVSIWVQQMLRSWNICKSPEFHRVESWGSPWHIQKEALPLVSLTTPRAWSGCGGSFSWWQLPQVGLRSQGCRAYLVIFRPLISLCPLHRCPLPGSAVSVCGGAKEAWWESESLLQGFRIHFYIIWNTLGEAGARKRPAVHGMN